MPRTTDLVVLGFLLALSAGAGVAWARVPSAPLRATVSPGARAPIIHPSPSPTPSPLAPCTADLIVTGLTRQRQLVGNPRPYSPNPPSDPPADAGFQFDLPQSYATHTALVLIYPNVSARQRAQAQYPPSDTVGGSGRLIWSLDSLAASDAAGYKLVLGDLTGSDQPCGQPAG